MSDSIKTISQRITANLNTIDELLAFGKFSTKSGECWVLKPLYQQKDCSIGFVEVGQTVEACVDHIHKEAVEYLIVVRGKVLLNIDGCDVRIVNAGECASIPVGAIHHSKPLEIKTKLIYVTVPADQGMERLGKVLTHGE